MLVISRIHMERNYNYTKLKYFKIHNEQKVSLPQNTTNCLILMEKRNFNQKKTHENPQILHDKPKLLIGKVLFDIQIEKMHNFAV